MSEIEQRRILNWTKRWFAQYELYDSIFLIASLKVSLRFRGPRAFGTIGGKKFEFINKQKDPKTIIITIRMEGDDKDWGMFQIKGFVPFSEPAVLQISDGREYNLVADRSDKFRLSSNDDRTILVTTFQNYNAFKSYVEIFNVTELEQDYLMLALVSFLPIALFNGQAAGMLGA
jgi:hypothetical protein